MRILSREINNFFILLKTFCLLTLSLLISQNSWAWGGRGHNTICEAASFLVKEKELKKFLQLRPHIMGHICNIPDIQWKNISGDVRAAGDPAHYVDPEILGFTPKTLPVDLDQLKKDFTGKQNHLDKEMTIFSVPRQVGSLYWRIDELMNNMAALKTDFAQAKPPQNKSEEQDNDFPFNKATYTFMTTAGIMGHYVGDAGQPYHNTADHDGWHSGHGGIHGYYEEALVGEIDGDLISKIMRKARTIKNSDWLKGSYVERMKSFGAVSFEDIKKIEKMDPVIKKSEVQTDKGMKIKTPAVRKDPSEVIKKFEPLIVTNMARSAWMLAELWDEAYRSMGSPKLSEYKLYKYPFNVDFMPPKYDDTPVKPTSVK